MEEEAQKLRQFTEEAENQNAVRQETAENLSKTSITSTGPRNEDEIMDEDPSIVDSRSIYVGNVCAPSSRWV
jgi:hypothetical protein